MTLLRSPLRVLAILACTIAALTATTAPATAAVRVKVFGSSAAPRVGERWTLTVSARKGGRAASGRVRVDVIVGGRVVSTVARRERLRFGRWSISQRWPSVAKGVTLTFRATVTAGGQRGVGSLTVTVRG